MAKRLPPLVETEDQWKDIAKQLLEAVRRAVYLPLLREVSEHEPERQLRNAREDLMLSVAKGEIQYLNGHFEGTFRAAVSRELRRLGATYDRRRRWWSLPFRELPVEVRIAIGTSRSKFQAMAERAERALASVLPERLAEHIDVGRMFDQAVFAMERQFRKNVGKVTVVPQLSAEVRRSIADEYLRSSKLDVADWTRREIRQLRETVRQNTFEYGLRREALVKGIQTRYGETARRARFIARQETSLIMAKYQQARYSEVGIRRYVWKCVNNPPRWITGPKGGRRLAPHSVRPDHWELNGTTQTWASPPIVDRESGRRAHPKEDFNCRCTAIPIVE